MSAEERPLLPADPDLAPRSTSRREPWVGIVDDDASIRSSLARLMRLEGVRAETFASAEEFLERIPRGIPDCLVLDVHLGGCSGFTLQDHLIARGIAPPIVFITAHNSIPVTRLAPHTGAIGFLRKPFKCHALLALVLPLVSAEKVELHHQEPVP